jgi:hypothetical protein
MVLEGNSLDIGLSIRPVIVQANWVIRLYKRGSLSLITLSIKRSVNIFRHFIKSCDSYSFFTIGKKKFPNCTKKNNYSPFNINKFFIRMKGRAGKVL